MTVNVADNRYGVAQFIVAPTLAEGANYTTIASALTAASSGQTIFIRPGTYTENLTLKAGVNLTSFGSESSQNGTGHVIISGNATMSTAGSVTISGIQLQTNSAAFLTVSGSDASIVNLQNCYLNCSNATGISFSTSSSSAQINIDNCNGDIGTTGISLFSSSSAGTLRLDDSRITNSGASTTVSTNSAGLVRLNYCILFSPVSNSSTGQTFINYCIIDTSAQNATCFTTAGNQTNNFFHSRASAGSASAISIGSGTIVIASHSSISSSNTNAITGAGTLTYSALDFTGTSSTINTTTQTANYMNLGKWRATGQPAFAANLGTTVTNVTGTGGDFTLGTTTALTEIFDQDSNFVTSGTFTAPVTGKYFLQVSAWLTGCTINIGNVVKIVTSNRTWAGSVQRGASSTDSIASASAIVDMDVADTSTFTTAGFGEAGATDDVVGNAAPLTYVSGCLIS